MGQMTASPFKLSCPSKSVSVHMHACVYMCVHARIHTHEHMHPHMGVCAHTQPQDAGMVQPAPPLLWSIFTPISVVGDKEELRKISGIWGREQGTPWKDLGGIVQLQGKEVHCSRTLWRRECHPGQARRTALCGPVHFLFPLSSVRPSVLVQSFTEQLWLSLVLCASPWWPPSPVPHPGQG